MKPQLGISLTLSALSVLTWSWARRFFWKPAREAGRTA